MTARDADGSKLGFEHVFEPGGSEDPAFTVLLLHGTGADQYDLLDLGRIVAPGKPVLSPLGKVRENGMARWFERVQEGVFDEDSIRERARELAGFIERATEAYELDPDRVVAVGFSNGANIAASLLLLHPTVLRGAVLLRAMTPLTPDELPDLSGVPVFVGSGKRDQLIPTGDAERLVEMLEDAGADVTHRVADAGHALDRSEVPRVRDWLVDREADLAAPKRSP